LSEARELLEELDAHLKELVSRAPELQTFKEYSERAKSPRSWIGSSRSSWPSEYP